MMLLFLRYTLSDLIFVTMVGEPTASEGDTSIFSSEGSM